MKDIIVLVVQYPATDWADEYGITTTQAVHDFAAALRRTVNDGALAEMLDANWPMMRGHLTAHLMDGLDSITHHELRQVLQEAHDGDQDRPLLTEITEYLTAYPQDLGGREPRWVTFPTWEWDNGHVLNGSEATVYFADGHSVLISFPDCVDARLLDMYGPRGSMGTLGVDLREGRLEFNDYGQDVPHLLGIPISEHHEGDGCAIYLPERMVTRAGAAVPITGIRTGDVFTDYDDKPWRAVAVGRDGDDVHVGITRADQG